MSMDEEAYLLLLNLVRPVIEKRMTELRIPINGYERLTATLRYLATGVNYQALKFSSCISSYLKNNRL